MLALSCLSPPVHCRPRRKSATTACTRKTGSPSPSATLPKTLRPPRPTGKRLAIVFEQRGCIYCAKMHEELLTDPEVRDYIKANYQGRPVQHVRRRGSDRPRRRSADGKEGGPRSGAMSSRRQSCSCPKPRPKALPCGMRRSRRCPAPSASGRSSTCSAGLREKGYERDEHFQIYHARHINELRAAGQLDAE